MHYDDRNNLHRCCVDLNKRINGETENYFKKQQLTIDDLKLLVGFEKSLMNKKNTPLKLIINENSSIYSITYGYPINVTINKTFILIE